jgi:hypothetical protein
MGKGKSPGGGSGPAGSFVRIGPRGRAMRIRTGGFQWSDEAEEAFFEHLAASGNVKGSAAAVGFATHTIYRQRQRRPEFAERFRSVLEHGYDQLELAMVKAALDSFDDEEFAADRPIPKMTVEQAVAVLRAHRNQLRGDGGRGPGRFSMPKDIAHYKASILRKIEAIKAAREADDSSSRGGEIR